MAAHTSQFAPIKCEGSQSLPQLYDFQRQHSPDFPLFAYTETATGLTLELTYRQVGERIHYAARRVMEELAISGTTVSTHPVIAVVAVAGKPSSSHNPILNSPFCIQIALPFRL